MNPKFDFWSKLLTLFQVGLRPDLVDKVTAIYLEHWRKLSIPYGIALEQWVTDFKEDGYTEQILELSWYAFADLASQMREEEVRKVWDGWRKLIGEEDEFHAHVRRITPLGGKAAVLTILVDDLERFRIGQDFLFTALKP